jgi:hypothetical protein
LQEAAIISGQTCVYRGIPLAFLYLGCWFLMAGTVYYFFGIETRGKSIEEIDRELTA